MISSLITESTKQGLFLRAKSQVKSKKVFHSTGSYLVYSAHFASFCLLPFFGHCTSQCFLLFLLCLDSTSVFYFIKISYYSDSIYFGGVGFTLFFPSFISAPPKLFSFSTSHYIHAFPTTPIYLPFF